jgi:predicted RNase H-like nuclease (RuvC/YqgF family)
VQHFKAQLEDSERAYTNQLTNERSMAQTLVKEKEALMRKVTHLESELKEMMKLNEDLHEQVDNLEREHSYFKSQTNETIRTVKSQNSDIQMKYQEEKQKWYVEKTQLMETIKNLKRYQPTAS